MHRSTWNGDEGWSAAVGRRGEGGFRLAVFCRPSEFGEGKGWAGWKLNMPSARLPPPRFGGIGGEFLRTMPLGWIVTVNFVGRGKHRLSLVA